MVPSASNLPENVLVTQAVESLSSEIPEPVRESKYGIEVFVISRELKPEAGVLVIANFRSKSGSEAESLLVEGRTDDSGYILLSVSEEGSYYVRATKDSRAAEANVRVTETHPGSAHLVLAPAGRIAGKVVNATGRSVGGARVSLSRKNHMRISGAAALCGADGRFEFTFMPPGLYVFMAEAEGYAPAFSETVEPDAPEITIGLRPGGRIVGHVVDAADGRSVKDFLVAARALEGERTLAPVTSDATGRFAFESLSDDTYLVFGLDATRVIVPGPSRVSVDHGRADVDVELRVTKGARITGVVQSETSGAAMGGVRAEIFLLEEDRGVTGMTDAEGVYVLDGVSPGRARIGFSYREINRGTDIEVPVGAAEVIVDFDWPESVRILGTVLDVAGAPVLDAEVVAQGIAVAERTSGWSASTRSGKGGAFIVENALPGEGVTIMARSKLGRAPKSAPFFLPSEGLENVVIQFSDEPLSMVSGSAVDARGRPVLARVRMTRLSSGPASDTQVRESAFSEADGFFLFRGLPAGEYAMEVGPVDKPNATLATPFGAGSVSLRPGENRTGLRVVLDSGGEISGTITDEAGTPLYRAV